VDRILLSECDFGLSSRYHKLIESAKKGFVKEEMYSFAHFPVILIIHDLRLKSCKSTLIFSFEQVAGYVSVKSLGAVKSLYTRLVGDIKSYKCPFCQRFFHLICTVVS